MNHFFSVVSDGVGNIMYFDNKLRRKITKGKLFDKNNNRINFTDDHYSIMAYNGIFGEDKDMYNKCEYDVFTKELYVDNILNKNDKDLVYKKIQELDFKKIVPELIIKPEVNHFKIDIPLDLNKVLGLLKEWNSVVNSTCYGVRHIVCDSVVENICYNGRFTLCDIVVGRVWNSVKYSVWNSIYYSAEDVVYAYVSSFFNIPKYKYIEHKEGVNPFQSGIDLWEMGIIPTYDGETWILYKAKNAEIIWQGKVEDMKE